METGWRLDNPRSSATLSRLNQDIRIMIGGVRPALLLSSAHNRFADEGEPRTQ